MLISQVPWGAEFVEQGVTKIDGFWSADACERARVLIDELIENPPGDGIQNLDDGNEFRLWGVNGINPKLDISQEPRLTDLLECEFQGSDLESYIRWLIG